VARRRRSKGDDGADQATSRLEEVFGDGTPSPEEVVVSSEEGSPAPPAEASREPPREQAPPPGNGAGKTMLKVDTLHVFYGAIEALRGVSFEVREGEVVVIIGSNGAGKTTTLKTLSGLPELLKHVRGHMEFQGQRIDNASPNKIARLGLAHVPEGRKIFPDQSVKDNLLLGAFQRSDNEVDKDIDQMYERFPILGERKSQMAGLMSGGEQQMLAIARALMARPKMILFDEPSMGLAPLIVNRVFEIIAELKKEGKTILLVEQMAFQALGLADRAYVLETGEITLEGTGQELLNDPRVKEAYLGA
jgi:branched-chain amino acid transport system ATP-binding protein